MDGEGNLMKIKGMIVAVLFFVNALSLAQANQSTPTEQSVNAIKNLVSSYKKGDVKQGVEMAMNALVKKGVDLLRAKGFKQDAQRFSHSWKAMRAAHALDIGDHQPLNQWMADYYEVLAQRFGENLLKQLHLDDVLVLNYTIPVVFKPNGNAKANQTWDIVEYRKHFVPFSGIVSYWVSLGVCMYASAQTGNTQLSENCTQIAGLIRKGMVMYPAPKLSDWIYEKATHKNSMIYIYGSAVVQKKDLEFLNEVLEQYN